MVDREKVIKGLECHVNGHPHTRCHKCPYWGTGPHGASECSDMVAGALALLKAQEPVKPVMDIDTWKCWNCGHTLEYQELLGDNVLFYEQYNYCPECGRAVKWE